MKMIRYILGKTGAGKSSLSYLEYSKLPNSVFFGDANGLNHFPDILSNNLEDKIINNSFINIIPTYRNFLEHREKFNQIMFEKIEETIKLKPTVIFLDEFQLYASKELSELIIQSKQHFCIIHQWPEQLAENVFPIIWEKCDEKFLLNPYPSPHYSV